MYINNDTKYHNAQLIEENNVSYLNYIKQKKFEIEYLVFWQDHTSENK